MALKNRRFLRPLAQDFPDIMERLGNQLAANDQLIVPASPEQTMTRREMMMSSAVHLTNWRTFIKMLKRL